MVEAPGGDEFAVLFLDTDRTTAQQLLHSMRTAHAAPWTVGITTADPNEDLPSILRRADANLRTSKHLTHPAGTFDPAETGPRPTS